MSYPSWWGDDNAGYDDHEDDFYIEDERQLEPWWDDDIMDWDRGW